MHRQITYPSDPARKPDPYALDTMLLTLKEKDMPPIHLSVQQTNSPRLYFRYPHKPLLFTLTDKTLITNKNKNRHHARLAA